MVSVREPLKVSGHRPTLAAAADGGVYVYDAHGNNVSLFGRDGHERWRRPVPGPHADTYYSMCGDGRGHVWLLHAPAETISQGNAHYVTVTRWDAQGDALTFPNVRHSNRAFPSVHCVGDDEIGVTRAGEGDFELTLFSGDGERKKRSLTLAPIKRGRLHQIAVAPRADTMAVRFGILPDAVRGYDAHTGAHRWSWTCEAGEEARANITDVVSDGQSFFVLVHYEGDVACGGQPLPTGQATGQLSSVLVRLNADGAPERATQLGRRATLECGDLTAHGGLARMTCVGPVLDDSHVWTEGSAAWSVSVDARGNIRSDGVAPVAEGLDLDRAAPGREGITWIGDMIEGKWLLTPFEPSIPVPDCPGSQTALLTASGPATCRCLGRSDVSPDCAPARIRIRKRFYGPKHGSGIDGRVLRTAEGATVLWSYGGHPKGDVRRPVLTYLDAQLRVSWQWPDLYAAGQRARVAMGPEGQIYAVGHPQTHHTSGFIATGAVLAELRADGGTAWQAELPFRAVGAIATTQGGDILVVGRARPRNLPARDPALGPDADHDVPLVLRFSPEGRLDSELELTPELRTVLAVGEAEAGGIWVAGNHGADGFVALVDVAGQVRWKQQLERHIGFNHHNYPRQAVLFESNPRFAAVYAGGKVHRWDTQQRGVTWTPPQQASVTSLALTTSGQVWVAGSTTSADFGGGTWIAQGPSPYLVRLDSEGHHTFSEVFEELSEVNQVLMTFRPGGVRLVVQGGGGYGSQVPYLAVADVDVPGAEAPQPQ